MENFMLRALFVGAAFALCGSGIASAATSDTPKVIAQNPAPKPTSTPSAFTFGGYLRAFNFTRMNSPSATKTTNQASFNPGVSLHAGYNFGGNFSVAGTYLYANPFNNCDEPASHTSAPCAKHPATIPGTNPDDTLPGYRLSTLYEAYLQYKDPSLFVRLGDQVVNSPWANASDSRLKPVAFRGGDVSYNLNADWAVEAMYMNRFEDRVQSDFIDSTLITQNSSFPDDGGVPNTGIPKGGVVRNNGFYYGRVGYTGGPLTANLHYYAFDQIANAIWADVKYGWKAYGKPFIALQGGTESNTGASQAGKINSQIFGIQGGYSPWNNVDLTVGADFIPVKSDTITLPAGAACSSKHMISGTLMYFLPSGGTPNCVPGSAPNTATIYYGGWASPYTDSYATDVLFDTSISQGMVDRRSPGSGVKIAGTFYTVKKQVRFIVSHAWYTYGNDTVGVAPTQETDVDGTYFFSRVGKGPYRGFSLRHRYAERTQSFTSAYGGTPDFKYNRTQLEYDF
jgi:hypothetical protein